MPEPKRPLKVFLCHASTDKPKVRELYRYLKKRGIQPWFDEEDLVGGQNWQVEIPKALATSDAIIICLTKNSVDKEGYIQKEIKFALDKALEMPDGRIFLIPVKFEECEVPFTLSSYQWVDLTVESGYSKMIKALKFRASQLERSTVEVSKKDVGEEKRLSVKKEEKPATVKPKVRGQFAYWFGGFIVLVLGIILLSSLNNLPPTPQPTPQNAQTQTIVALAQDTAKPSATTKLTSTPTNTQTPTPISTVTQMPTATNPSTPFAKEISDLKNVSMRLVAAGEFKLGDENDPDASPEAYIYLRSFYIDKFEVTNKKYKECVDTGECLPPKNVNAIAFVDLAYYNNPKFYNYPVVNVDWHMANTYCQWRGARLPTEAEWEKSARGFSNDYPWGDEPDCRRANYESENCSNVAAPYTLPVGSFEDGKSDYGVYDLIGNVSEWVNSWYAPYPYNSMDGREQLEDVKGAVDKVVRGTGWMSGVQPSFFRYFQLPDHYSDNLGFRCAKDATP